MDGTVIEAAARDRLARYIEKDRGETMQRAARQAADMLAHLRAWGFTVTETAPGAARDALTLLPQSRAALAQDAA